MTTMQIIHVLAGFVVLVEALNKLERTSPLHAGPGLRARVTEWLKALAWMLLALGGAGAIVAPFCQGLVPPAVSGQLLPLVIPVQGPTLQDVCLAVGFAVLIVRTRVKEG